MCMCACVFVCLCVYACACVYVGVFVCVCVRVYVFRCYKQRKITVKFTVFRDVTPCSLVNGTTV